MEEFDLNEESRRDAVQELDRQKKVISMMITAYSMLYEKYKARAFFVDLLLLVSGGLLNTFVFFDYKNFEKYLFIRNNTDETDVQNIIGIFSILTFILTLISIASDWKKKAEQFLQSKNNLVKFHLKINVFCKNDSQQINDLMIEYTSVMESLPVPIPDSKFNKYKSKHLRKVDLSKAISKFPNVPILILKLKLTLTDIRKFLS